MQLVDPNQKENINQTSTNKLYNEERLYDRTAISCVSRHYMIIFLVNVFPPSLRYIKNFRLSGFQVFTL